MKQIVNKSPDQIRKEIDDLNLDAIKFKLMDPVEGESLTRKEVDDLEKQYKQFLFLTVTRSEPIAPTKDIDMFWHAHILDTMKYIADCDRLFGFYLHHFPYFGMRGAEDSRNLQQAFEHTQKLWCEVFGTAPSSVLNAAEATNCNTCGASSCAACQSNCVGSTCSGFTTHGGPFEDVMRTNWRPTLSPID